MTINDLSKYFFINKEIQQLNEKLEKLESTSVGVSKISGMPHSGGVSNPVENLVLKKLELEELINKKLLALTEEEIKLEKYIDNIEDKNIKLIIRLRFIDSKTWQEIANELYCERTTPYYQLKKYLELNNGKSL